MHPLHGPEIHLSPTPEFDTESFPESLRGEIEELAREIHESRIAGDLISYPLDNWLEAETLVIARHVDMKELACGSRTHH